MTDWLGRAVLGITDRSLVRRTFTNTKPGRALARRFVAGESLDEAIAVAEDLIGAGFDVSLDHLGEHVTHRQEAMHARNDYMACLDRIGASGLAANISVKLTQLGMGLDDDLAAASLSELAARAAEVGTSVTVDMEESDYTDTTVAIYEKTQSEHGNLGIAVQSYLKRTAADLDRLIPLGGHIRLCKGAYAESEEVAFQSNDAVNAEFDRLLDVLIAAPGIKPAIASHDEARISAAKRLIPNRQAPYEFQMLYGVRGPLQRQLLADGYPVRIYVPYGAAWYPYLTRRLAERPANTLFFLRALFGRR
ncbi:MAG: proline dehydrogenase [Acidimicrobiia bacterium]|nr:proline dehydrogenase [Acidimicrobiia bacterium]